VTLAKGDSSDGRASLLENLRCSLREGLCRDCPVTAAIILPPELALALRRAGRAYIVLEATRHRNPAAIAHKVIGRRNPGELERVYDSTSVVAPRPSLGRKSSATGIGRTPLCA